MTAGLERTWVAHYGEGVPTEIEPPRASLVGLLAQAVDAYGPRPALEFFGTEMTYAELGRRVGLAAEGLRRLGVGAGDRVALVLVPFDEASFLHGGGERLHDHFGRHEGFADQSR